MKIIVMGYHDIGHACLKEPRDAGADVGGLVTPGDTPNETTGSAPCATSPSSAASPSSNRPT